MRDAKRAVAYPGPAARPNENQGKAADHEQHEQDMNDEDCIGKPRRNHSASPLLYFRLSRFDRPRGIGAPFAPGPGIEARSAQPGDLHGEEVVAGGNSGAAVGHDVFPARGPEDGTEILSERFGRLETPPRIEVVSGK